LEFLSGDAESIFVDAKTFLSNTPVTVDWKRAPDDYFLSFSHAHSPGVVQVGIAYCIDLAKYRSDLRKRGVKVAASGNRLEKSAHQPRSTGGGNRK
jgi:hypothetical protein